MEGYFGERFDIFKAVGFVSTESVSTGVCEWKSAYFRIEMGRYRTVFEVVIILLDVVLKALPGQGTLTELNDEWMSDVGFP